MIRLRTQSLCFLLATAGLKAQEIAWHAIGQVNADWFATPVAVIGDVDGDGCDEVLNVGQANQQIRSVVYVLSGRTGRILRTRPTPFAHFWYRPTVVRAGDWNGDGIGDYAVTRYAWSQPFDPSVVEILSGRDDSVLFVVPTASTWAAAGGEHILSDLDTDGDGRPDLVFSVERETTQDGAFYVYANSGSLRYRLPVQRGNTNLGKVGDVDHDGCDDFGYWYSPASTVRVVSGRTGATLLNATGDFPNDHMGSGEIVACGDVNLDGTPDFAGSSNGIYPTNGIVRVFSGKDATPLFTFRKRFPPNGSGVNFGESIASGFDLDQDGIPDLVVGGCQYFCDLTRSVGNRLYVYLLRDGREVEICTPGLSSIQQFTWFGFRVAAGRPQAGNPFPVFACGEGYYGQGGVFSYQGRVTLFRLPPAALRSHGQSCAGTLGRAPRAGVVDLGANGVRLQVSDAPPGVPAVLLVGTSNQSWLGFRLPLVLDPWGFVGCQLDTSVLVTLPALTGRFGIDAGYASLDVALPIASSAERGMVYAQWVVLGSGRQAPGALSAAMGWPY